MDYVFFMKIILLTHTREILRANNTGQLVSKVLGGRAQVIEWHRTQPDVELLSLIEEGKVGLVFPSDEALVGTDVQLVKNEYLLLIDATWQEARKMYNQSPYLKGLPKVPLLKVLKSKYQLRRNQIENGLCTAECVIHLLMQSGDIAEAQLLNQSLLKFIGTDTDQFFGKLTLESKN